MKIAPFTRVVYELNPLAEVVCQLRFPRVLDLETNAPSTLQKAYLDLGYGDLSIEEPTSLTVAVQTREGPKQAVARPSGPRTFHFSSGDEGYRVSVCADFLALTCTKYKEWGHFLAALQSVAAPFLKQYSPGHCSRIGLRYRDIIDREPLALEGSRWKDLLSPFVVGLLAADSFFADNGRPDDCIDAFSSQCVLRLDDCDLLLQTALLGQPQSSKKAFLVDADFYKEQLQVPAREGDIAKFLDALHGSAGPLFRHCITDTLHNALKPQQSNSR